MNSRKGFTMIELLVVIAIIGVLATIATVVTTGALKKARDAKRKLTLAQAGRLFVGQRCYVPDAGGGDYDLGELFGEVVAKNPQLAQYVTSVPKDPKGGTDAVTKYRYTVTADGADCALYANLESDGEAVTISGISAPTPGGGTGVFAANVDGPNGSKKYFQAANK